MTHATLVARWRPATAGLALAYDAAAVLAGSVFIALSAQLAVPLPLTPVPITGQTFAVLLAGALLGPARGLAAVALYLLEGVGGLPVFAGGGFGAGHLLGPTGGYLVGFLPAAWLTGFLAQRGWDRRFVTTVAAMSLGTAALFVPGVLYLAAFVGFSRAVYAGLLPFLPGAVVKILLAACLLPSAWRLLRRLRL